MVVTVIIVTKCGMIYSLTSYVVSVLSSCIFLAQLLTHTVLFQGLVTIVPAS